MTERYAIWVDGTDEVVEAVEALLQDAGIAYYQSERD